MTDVGKRGVPTPVSAGIDAFRRHEPLPAGPTASRALDDLVASVDPCVVLTALARLSVSIGFADGCDVELADGARPPFRASEGADVEPPPRACGGSRTLTTPVRGPARGPFESFSGVLVHRWRDHEPDEHDRLLADVLARHAVAVVDRQRLVQMLAEQEERSSQLTLQAITGRWTHLAVGLIMSRSDVDAAEAEHLLRTAARRRGITPWDLALEVVHTRDLPGAPALRSVRDGE